MVDAKDELARIEALLGSTFEGPAWHGPAVLELLESVGPEQAAAHPIPGAHSIWELVLHLTGSYGLVLRRLRGDGSPFTAEEDWPLVPEPTEANWLSSINALSERNREIRAAILAFDPERLADPLVPVPDYSAYVQFVGLTQHDLYHAGQIALLTRMLARS